MAPGSRIAPAVLLLVLATTAYGEPWNAEEIAKQDTISLRTNVPGEGEYWFPVWVVVLDGDPYVRLGSRAGARVQRNLTFPELAVRVNGQTYEQVRGEASIDRNAEVDAAMAEKYPSDVFVRWFPHPMVLRLVQHPPAPNGEPQP